MSTYPIYPSGDSFYKKSISVTPSDVTVLSPTRGLYITGTGNLTVVYLDDTEDTFTAIPANTIMPLCVKQVKAATTATNIKALY